MATSFPTGLDSFTTLVDNSDDVLASHPNDRGDSIEALEAKVGVDSSGVNTSQDFLLRNLPAQDGTSEVSNLNAALLNGSAGTAFFVFRAGDLLLSSSTSTPSGWSDVSGTYNNKFIRISSGTALNTAGSDTHNHGGTTGSHVLTIAEMPAHTHSYNTVVAPGAGNSGGALDTVSGQTTGSTGGNNGHNHTISSANNIPAYVQLKMYKKS